MNNAIQAVRANEWDERAKELDDRGIVALPDFLSPEELVHIQNAINKAFEDAPYGRDERTDEPLNENRIVGLGADVDILSIYKITDLNIGAILSKQALQNLLTEELGENYYLDRAIIRRARGKCGRFYYHKDQHGDIGLAILLNDLGSNAGATTVLPGRHLGTPPTLFALKNINVEHPEEMQLTGKAGDGYLFHRDIDHSRAENVSGKDNIQILLTFVNKNTVPASHARLGIDESDFKDLNGSIKNMLRPFDGSQETADKSFAEKMIYGTGFSSPGAGDYDVRNDLLRDIIYTTFFVRGKALRTLKKLDLPRNTTRLNETRRVSMLHYLGQLHAPTTIRALTLQLIRIIPGGQNLVKALKRLISPN